LDSSTVILLGTLKPEDLPAESYVSAVTLAELSVGPLLADDPAERAAGKPTSSRRNPTSQHSPSPPQPAQNI
jgi:hypothetical protein